MSYTVIVKYENRVDPSNYCLGIYSTLEKAHDCVHKHRIMTFNQFHDYAVFYCKVDENVFMDENDCKEVPKKQQIAVIKCQDIKCYKAFIDKPKK
jgi:hypothetical protein